MFLIKRNKRLDTDISHKLTEILSTNPVIQAMVKRIHREGFTVAYHLKHDRDTFFQVVNAEAHRKGLSSAPRLGSIADAMLMFERREATLRASENKVS